LVSEHSIDPRENAQLSESLSMAFLLLLERLSPTERAVFLLRDVFGYEFEAISLIIEKSEDNCRQIITRARGHLREGRRRYESPDAQTELVLQRFFQAVTTGDVDGLLAVLAPDATVLADGGGQARAVRRPIVGADRVLRFLLGTMKRFVPANRVFRRARINGQLGVIGYDSNRPVQVLSFLIANGQVARVYIINNPEKLRALSRLA
jgi:RNA polymerase sigma-70 factor (ECF subfamily)